MYFTFQNKLKIILYLSICFLVIFFINLFLHTKSDSELLFEAEEHYRHWNLIDAEKLLENLIRHDGENQKIQTLYGRVLLESGELYKARSILLKLFAKDTLNSAETAYNLASVYYFLGNFDSSAIFTNKVMESISRKENLSLLSRSLNLLGLIAFNRARYKSARSYQEKSLAVAREANLKNEEANALRQIGVLEWYGGNADSVIELYYEPALKLYRETGNKKGEATTLSNIGLIFNTYENWILNLKYQLQAFEIRKKINDKMGLADSYYFLTHSISHSKKGKSFVYSYCLKSYKLSERIGYAWGKDVALRGLIDLRNEALDDFEIQPFDFDNISLPDNEGDIYKFWKAALNHLKKNDLATAALYFENGIELCDSLGYLTGIEASLINFAEVLTKLGNFEYAEKIALRAIQITRELNRPNGYAEALHAAANLYSGMGRKNESEKIFSQLVQFYDALYKNYLNQLNPSIAFETASGSVHYMRGKVYRDYAALLISQNKFDRAFEVIEEERLLPFWGLRENEQNDNNSDENNLSLKLINLFEELDTYDFEKMQIVQTKLGEIYQSILTKQTIYSDAYYIYEDQKAAGLSELQSALRNNEVLLEYFIDENRVNLFAAGKHKNLFIKLNITTDELASVVEVLSETILQGKISPGSGYWKKPARYLYKALIEPVINAGLMEKGSHLIISPHQILHYVPFQALLLSEGEAELNFMIEDYFITYIPSASYLIRKRKEPSKAIDKILAITPDDNDLP